MLDRIAKAALCIGHVAILLAIMPVLVVCCTIALLAGKKG